MVTGELLLSELEWDELTEASEDALVRAIVKHLYTEEQRNQLTELGLSVRKVVCEQFGPEHQKLVDRIRREWNKRLGFVRF